MPSFTDNFNRANETPLASPWTKVAPEDVNLSSNHLVSNASTGNHLYYYSGSCTSADQFSSMEVFDRSGTNCDGGPAVRVGSNHSGYFYAMYDVGTAQEIYLITAGGTYTSIQSWSDSYNWATGDRALITSNGSLITVYRNGVQQGSATNSSISAQQQGAGFFIFDANMDYDNWHGGDLETQDSAILLNRATTSNTGLGASIGGFNAGTAPDLMVVTISTDGYTECEVTYNSIFLTMAVQNLSSGLDTAQVWYLEAPDAGVNDLIITSTDSVLHYVSVTTWMGTGAALTLDSFTSNGNTDNSPTQTFSGNTGYLAVDVVTSEHNANPPMTSYGSDQMPIYNTGSGTFGFASSWENAPSGAEVMNWGAGSSDVWVNAAASFGAGAAPVAYPVKEVDYSAFKIEKLRR